jgi:cell division protein ZapA (FtsZ GTPase activity inhibitor)
LYELGPLVRYLENRAYEAINARTKLERKQAAAERRQGRKKQDLAQKLRYARQAEAKAITLAGDVALLGRWLREDILSVAGPEFAIRRELYDFVVVELRAREPACPHRIKPVRQLLENQRDHLLAFAVDLDRDLAALAQQWQIGSATAREVLEMQALPVSDPRRRRREAALRETLRGRYHGVSADVEELSAEVVRASSLVENLNSRLRNYFFLRRCLGENYLVLLQFFLNHRRYLRSEHPHRVGKSPTELLTGEPHGHWLELLGYTPYVRS